MIYHILKRQDWEKAVKNISYKPDSLDKEGFIHCSPIERVKESADNFFKGQKNLIILCINESKVTNKIIWEDLYGHGFKFPHIYGKLNLDAVVYVKDFIINDSSFDFL